MAKESSSSDLVSWMMDKMPLDDIRHDVGLGLNVAAMQLKVRYQVQNQILLPDLLETAADRWPERIALVGLQDEPPKSRQDTAGSAMPLRELLWPNTWTYRQWDQYANQVVRVYWQILCWMTVYTI